MVYLFDLFQAFFLWLLILVLYAFFFKCCKAQSLVQQYRIKLSLLQGGSTKNATDPYLKDLDTFAVQVCMCNFG